MSILVKMNHLLQLADYIFFAVSNIFLLLLCQSGKHIGSKIVFIDKCTFFQDQTALKAKVQGEVDAYPGIFMMMMLII